MAGNKKRVVQFWGREFDIVNQGLSQSQVYAFINELINENEILAEKTERLALMERLAGETLFEADRLAMSIGNNAQQEATHILQSFEEEAAKIKANIREEVKQLLVETKEKLTSEMKQNGDKIHRRILRRLEQAMTDVQSMEPMSAIADRGFASSDCLLNPLLHKADIGKIAELLIPI